MSYKINNNNLQAQKEPPPMYSADIDALLDEVPELMEYITPEFKYDQALVVLEGLEAEVDVTRYNDPKYNYRQMQVILDGLKQGIDITPWVNTGTDSGVMLEVIQAVADGLSDVNIRVVADTRWDWRQAQEIRLGLKSGVDINRYANPLNSWQTMKETRLTLESVFVHYEIHEVDSIGNPLSAQQSSFFENSRIRDNQGRLLLCYHGTFYHFTEFKHRELGFHFGSTMEQAINCVNHSYCPDADFPDGIIMLVYINICNPLHTASDMSDWGNIEGLHDLLGGRGLKVFTNKELEPLVTPYKIRTALMKKGYDGIMYDNAFEGAGVSFIAFEPNQIKLIHNKYPSCAKEVNANMMRQ